MDEFIIKALLWAGLFFTISIGVGLFFALRPLLSTVISVTSTIEREH